jgi:hypothetical protein
MKTTLLIVIILHGALTVNGQASSSVVEVVTVYSQNDKFYLRSIPYDNEFPTLRGKTYVYQTGNAVPMYVLDRGFDSVEKESNNLILSNDGEVIFFAIPFEANEDKEGLKSVTIYRHGRIIRSFTETEVNGCDKKKERCSLVYNNYEEVIDKEKSNWGTRNYHKVFKERVDDQEKFLSDFPIFSSEETVYLTDSKKILHQFDLRDGALLQSDPFEKVFSEVNSKGRFTRVEFVRYEPHTYLDFPKLKDGKDSYQALAAYLGMKPASLIESRDQAYKLYSFEMNANMARDGTLEIETIDIDPGLSKEKILEFFRVNRFDITLIPSVFERWHFSSEFFSFRNANDKVAREEKRQQVAEGRKRRAERMTLERIDGVYIPKDLGECFVELDRLLSEIDKKEMTALSARDGMIAYHLGLGMWMRNNWGLHGGSRLLKYFTDKGLRDPEDMSTIVLFQYYDWLKGNKETWKAWENHPVRPFAEPTDQRFVDTLSKRPRP